MGLGALGELQMQSRVANGRQHTSFLSPKYHPPKEKLGLASLDNDTVDWLHTTTLNI